jgi:hypothetical protein
MARVDVGEVRAILPINISGSLLDPQIQGAINSATIMVDRLAEAPCHNADSLKQVEVNLAADRVIVTSAGGALKSRKMGDATDAYRTSGSGHSDYYDTAVMLDCSGLLVNFGKMVADIITIGTI